MPKRKKSGNNPLSSARKDVGGLWHRKSGAGYHLFLSYYGNQPLGVVTDDNDSHHHQSVSKSATNTAAAVQSGGVVKSVVGNSRAAKKRRRKKNGGNSSPADANAIASMTASSSSSSREPAEHMQAEDNFQGDDTHVATADVDASHPLIQAFNSESNKYPHLTNFIHTLSRPLPLTLRIRKHESANSSEITQTLLNFSNFVSPVSYDPTKQIYQSTPGSNLCKFNLGHLCPELKPIVIDASMNGTLARQELGSMLPVLSLEAVGAMKKGSKVLDMCASPGSKTVQALEIVVSVDKTRGRVIANDVHPKRLDSLREAVHRSGVPTELKDRVTYTNFDASVFPSPKSKKLFDAIICDVPCSGDGTIRKDPHILPMWSPRTSNELHGLQLKILLRAMELVKKGGVICYSTCSLNPIEDEAVVSAALSEMNQDDDNSYQLLGWPEDLLPGFTIRPGVDSWKVAFYDENNIEKDEDDFGSLSFYDSYDDAVDAEVGEANASFWPNSENKNLSLHRCCRLFPQDQDTGGFFVALIKRIK
jgi:16S rRNA C967 or C1407 C5-methylase (RsmB/RsmF family)